MKIGIIREGKVPPEKRVALLPSQCLEIKRGFPELEIFIQPYSFRCVADNLYEKEKLPLKEEMDICDILLGIKEVPVEKLIKDKTYFFFSHTIKKQSHNQQLLKTIIEKGITLVDYECLVNPVTHERLIAFGRYAGIVGAYNAIWMYGKKHKSFHLKRAYTCYNYAELQQEYLKVKLPPIKIVITGAGRVGRGAMEVLDGMNITKVSPSDFLEKTYNKPVYTVLQSKDYHSHLDGRTWDNEEFHANPQNYESGFSKYAKVADMLIASAFWNPAAPVLFTHDEMLSPDFRIRDIADITCDIDGSIPATVLCSTIDDPVFDYDPVSKSVKPAFSNLQNHISVMSIDNLPCELPYDASEYFGRQFIEFILPHFFNGDERKILGNATIVKAGKLTDKFSYLKDFVS